MTSRSVAFASLFFLVIIVLPALGFLQSKLAKKENEAIGLILPTAAFVLSVLLLLSLGVLNNETPSFAEYIGGIAIWFFVLNIPTAVFLIIFQLCRKNQKAKKEIEKMNIMDLE